MFCISFAEIHDWGLQAEYFRLVSLLVARQETPSYPPASAAVPDLADSPSEALAMRSLEDGLRQDVASGDAELMPTGILLCQVSCSRASASPAELPFGPENHVLSRMPQDHLAQGGVSYKPHCAVAEGKHTAKVHADALLSLQTVSSSSCCLVEGRLLNGYANLMLVCKPALARPALSQVVHKLCTAAGADLPTRSTVRFDDVCHRIHCPELSLAVTGTTSESN